VRKPAALTMDAEPGTILSLAPVQPAMDLATPSPATPEKEAPVAEELIDAEELSEDPLVSDAEFRSALGGKNQELVSVAEYRLNSECLLRRAPLVVVSLTAAAEELWDVSFAEKYGSQHYVFEPVAIRAGASGRGQAEGGADTLRLVSSPGVRRKDGGKDANLATWLKRLELKYADVLRVDLARTPGSGVLLMRVIPRALPFTQIALRFDAPGGRPYPENSKQRIVAGLRRRGFSVIATSARLGSVTLLKTRDIPYCRGTSDERGP
jgi:hypothetical protein